MEVGGKVNIIIVVIVCFLIVLFLNSSYAIEKLDSSSVYILGLHPVQGQSRTLQSSNIFSQPILIPPMFNIDHEEIIDDFKPNIELEGVSFSILESDSFIYPEPIKTSVQFPDIEIEEVEVKLPIEIEVIDREEEIIRLILGDSDKSNISFIVKEDGFYDLEGEFIGSSIEFKWENERFKITLNDCGEDIAISIRPFEEGLAPKVCYKRDIELIGFEGYYSLGFINYKPYLDIVLKESDEEVLSIDLDRNKLSLKLNMDVPLTSRDSISLESDSFTFKDGDIDGNIEIRFDEEEQKVVLRIGEGSYFEITQNSSMREIIDRFYTEIAVDLERLLPELAEDDDSLDATMTVEDIKDTLWEATGSDLEGMFDIIQDVNEQRKGLVVPSEVRLFLDLSRSGSQRNAELVFPLIEDSLALKLNLGSDYLELSCLFDISSFSNASTAEVGYNSEGLFIFKIADLSRLSLARLNISLDSGIESLAFRVRDIEGDISRDGFELRSVEDSLLGLSALDILLRGLGAEDGNSIRWSLGYDFEDSIYLGASIPLSEEARIRGRLSSTGFCFSARVNFMGGVVMVDSNGSIEYRIDRDNIDFKFIINNE